MWFCCCPNRKNSDLDLKNSLIEQQQSSNNEPSSIITSQNHPEPKKEVIIGEHKSMTPMRGNDELEKVDTSKSREIQRKIDSIGIPPNFSKTETPRPFSPREHQKTLINSHKKSHLWKQPLKSDLIYIGLVPSKRVYMNYRLLKNQQSKQYQDGLDYYLAKSQDKIHLIIGKQQMFHNKSATLNKYSFNTINAVVINSQAKYITSFSSQFEVVLTQDLRSIRKTGVNSIVIMADSLGSTAEVKEYLEMIFKDLKWDHTKKITYLLPSFMSIEEISKILFSCLEQFIKNLPLESISVDLCFEMELIEGVNLDSCIVIKNRSEQAKLSNAIYDHMKLPIVFFEKELCDTTQSIFIDFYIQSKDKSLKEYFQMKEFYRKNPNQFLLRRKKGKEEDTKNYSQMANCPSLKDIKCEDGVYFVISSKVREEIGKLYNIPELQQKQLDTPMKKQWDDDATASDFKTSKKGTFDLIAKQELDKIDLDMGLGDNSSDDHEDDRNASIVISMEETRRTRQ